MKTTFPKFIFLLLVLSWWTLLEKSVSYWKHQLIHPTTNHIIHFLRVSKREKHQTWIINSWQQLKCFGVFTSHPWTYKHKHKIIKSTHGTFSFMQRKKKRELTSFNLKRNNSSIRKKKTITRSPLRTHWSNGVIHHDLHEKTWVWFNT